MAQEILHSDIHKNLDIEKLVNSSTQDLVNLILSNKITYSNIELSSGCVAEMLINNPTTHGIFSEQFGVKFSKSIHSNFIKSVKEKDLSINEISTMFINIHFGIHNLGQGAEIILNQLNKLYVQIVLIQNTACESEFQTLIKKIYKTCRVIKNHLQFENRQSMIENTKNEAISFMNLLSNQINIYNFVNWYNLMIRGNINIIDILRYSFKDGMGEHIDFMQKYFISYINEGTYDGFTKASNIITALEHIKKNKSKKNDTIIDIPGTNYFFTDYGLFHFFIEKRLDNDLKIRASEFGLKSINLNAIKEMMDKIRISSDSNINSFRKNGETHFSFLNGISVKIITDGHCIKTIIPNNGGNT